MVRARMPAMSSRSPASVRVLPAQRAGFRRICSSSRPGNAGCPVEAASAEASVPGARIQAEQLHPVSVITARARNRLQSLIILVVCVEVTWRRCCSGRRVQHQSGMEPQKRVQQSI